MSNKSNEDKNKKEKCGCIAIKNYDSILDKNKLVCYDCLCDERSIMSVEKFKTRTKKSINVTVGKTKNIYIEEETDITPKITLNKDDKTYSLSAVIHHIGDERDCYLIDGWEARDIAKKLGFNNLETLINDSDDDDEDYKINHVYIAPKDKIKKIYTYEEFENFKQEYQYAIVEIENAYKKRVEEIHSKKCNCGKCPNKKE